MWELEHKEGWVPNNWFFWTVVLEKTLESPLGSKEIKPVNQINQSWTLIGRTDAEAEVPILGPPYANCPLIGKYPDAGKDWGKEDKQETEDEIVGWYHQLNRHESEQTLGDWKHGSLVACSPRCCRVGHNRVNNNKKTFSSWNLLENMWNISLGGYMKKSILGGCVFKKMNWRNVYHKQFTYQNSSLLNHYKSQ